MEGTIYDLIPPAEYHVQKGAMYRSKFTKNVKGEVTEKKTEHRTMGQAKVPLTTTDDFLKKRSKEPVLPDKTDFHYPDEERRKAHVPTKDEKPLMGLKTTKNFINTNAIENITSVPKKAEKIYVDTRKGDKKCLIPSGLEPIYTQKKDFGEVPDYLKKRNQDIVEAQHDYDSYIKERCRKGAMKMLTPDERQQIIQGLKKNWEEVHLQYQGLSVVTDTVSKKSRKERMEASMKELEKYIELMEKHNAIYIAN